MDKEYYEAISTMVGFIIGAGILGIPFVIAKSGFLIGVIDILVIGTIFLFRNLYLGEIILRTKGTHQLSGISEIYLGSIGKWLMSFSLLFGLTGAIIAYIIKGGEFLNVLFQPSFGGSPILYSLLFFVIMTALVKRGIKMVEKSELYMVGTIMVIIVVLLFISFKHINPANLATINAEQIFLPFGVIMFALLGTAAIPEMKIVLEKKKHLIKKAIIWGSIIPVVIYILFAFIILGITGSSTTDGAILGLQSVLGYKVMVIGILFGLLTMATSFIAIGIALKEVYMFDYKIKPHTSYIMACYIPLAFTLLIFITNIGHAFFTILDITGIFAGGIVGFLVVPMIWKAKKHGKRKPEYIIKDNYVLEWSIIVISALGMIFEFLRYGGIFG